MSEARADASTQSYRWSRGRHWLLLLVSAALGGCSADALLLLVLVDPTAARTVTYRVYDDAACTTPFVADGDAPVLTVTAPEPDTGRGRPDKAGVTIGPGWQQRRVRLDAELTRDAAVTYWCSCLTLPKAGETLPVWVESVPEVPTSCRELGRPGGDGDGVAGGDAVPLPAGCTTATDCGAAPVCRRRDCVDGVCREAPAAAGTSCGPRSAADCPRECDDQGRCLYTAGAACQPGPCAGSCDVTGACQFALPSSCGEGACAGTCTASGACDGPVAGTLCEPDDNPCDRERCDGAGACVIHEPVPDGTAVPNGPTPLTSGPAWRCCSGRRVDLATDEAHCGGCGLACGAGLECESIANLCWVVTGNSGRCKGCSSAQDCPPEQSCRTESPFANRCEPNLSTSRGCAVGEVVVELQPNDEWSYCSPYCSYPY